MTAAQEQRYESLQIWDNNRIIDDLNDIAVLVKQTQYTSIDEVFQAYDQAIISGYEGLVMMHKTLLIKWEDIA
jgi:ADP-dependent phosphofructokinase/glucokinase